ncbi:hypothetical protein [Halobellus sp. GM3]|uniref:hypothetical protein n=1 Tax=Halobellus sp. GM3 TaxID=3458410 RepID=UPI00403DCD42
MRRLFGLFVLCVLLVALVVGFGVAFAGSDAYPDAEGIDDEYASYVGERVHLWAEVVGTDNGRVVVETDGLYLTVTSPPPDAVAEGDTVQLYGTLLPDRRMDTVASHTQSSGDIRYMYAVSVVGASLAAGLFLRRWRVDTADWQFVPREDE